MDAAPLVEEARLWMTATYDRVTSALAAADAVKASMAEITAARIRAAAAVKRGAGVTDDAFDTDMKHDDRSPLPRPYLPFASAVLMNVLLDLTSRGCAAPPTLAMLPGIDVAAEADAIHVSWLNV
jgi:hypothetical protein